MVDLVGTVALDDWEAWLAEGDCSGDAPTGEEWGWYTKHGDARLIRPGERFYVVSHGRVRGYALVTAVLRRPDTFVICRRAASMACTIVNVAGDVETPVEVQGFRGVVKRWWALGMERPYPDWKTDNVKSAEERNALKRLAKRDAREAASPQAKLFD